MKFDIIVCGDLQGIYLNGILIAEGQDISVSNFLKCLTDYHATGRISSRVNEIKELVNGLFPSTLDRVKF